MNEKDDLIKDASSILHDWTSKLIAEKMKKKTAKRIHKKKEI